MRIEYVLVILKYTKNENYFHKSNIDAVKSYYGGLLSNQCEQSHLEYFVHDVQINGVEQLGLKAKKWMLEAKQMKPGVLGGRNYVIFLPGIDFGVRTTNLAVVEIGQLPTQRISLFLLSLRAALPLWAT